jgi:hypothetical protein
MAAPKATLHIDGFAFSTLEGFSISDLLSPAGSQHPAGRFRRSSHCEVIPSVILGVRCRCLSDAREPWADSHRGLGG